MNSDRYSLVTALLIDPDVARIETVMCGVSASPVGGACVSSALVDVLLYFSLRGARPSHRTRDALIRAAIEHESHLPKWQPHQRLLRTLLVRVLECDAEDIEITDECADGVDDNYWLASRCAAAHVAEPAIARPATETARDCCLFLQRCEYLAAARALSSLAALGPSPASLYAAEVQRFREQATAYLADVVRIHPLPELQWEWLLCEYAA